MRLCDTQAEPLTTTSTSHHIHSHARKPENKSFKNSLFVCECRRRCNTIAASVVDWTSVCVFRVSCVRLCMRNNNGIYYWIHRTSGSLMHRRHGIGQSIKWNFYANSFWITRRHTQPLDNPTPHTHTRKKLAVVRKWRFELGESWTQWVCVFNYKLLNIVKQVYGHRLHQFAMIITIIDTVAGIAHPFSNILSVPDPLTSGSLIIVIDWNMVKSCDVGICWTF